MAAIAVLAYIAPMIPTRIETVSRASLVATAMFTVLIAAFFSAQAFGHPEDEFCVPGQDGLDPALCRALAALDSGNGGSPDAELNPLLDDAGNVRGFWSTFRLYTGIGVGHILPGGLDHILFVLALVLGSSTGRAVIVQITAFTIAHTATLGLAASGVISPSPAIVEPVIALTIAFVAIENLVFREMRWWRPIVVFGFGLVHGMGFAGFFGELGLPQGQFLSALLGFNVGVEVGQLSIVAAALVAAAIWRRADRVSADTTYRRYVAVPLSLAIGAVGLWWTVERIANYAV